MCDPAPVWFEPQLALLSGSFVAILIGVSMVICVIGHMVRTRIVLVVGLLMVFISTALMILGGLVAYQDASEPVPDPLRPGPSGVGQVPENETVGERRQRQAEEKQRNDKP